MNVKPRPSLRRRGSFAACAALVIVAGCGVIGPTSYQLYTLRPSPSQSVEAPNAAWQLAVAVPEAPANLDSSRIALSQSRTTMDYFANAAWTDRATTLVQSFLIEAFENSGKVKSVSRDVLALHADYLLQTELRDFQAEYAQPNAAPQAVVRIKSKLVRLPDREILGTFTAEKSVQAGANNLDSIVTAFNEAMGVALQQTVEWTLRTAPPPKPPEPASPRKTPKAKGPAAVSSPPEPAPAAETAPPATPPQ
jgi:cholesterol transport system auxiliary component